MGGSGIGIDDFARVVGGSNPGQPELLAACPLFGLGACVFRRFCTYVFISQKLAHHVMEQPAL